MIKLEIPVKYLNENTIYTIKKIRIEKNCHICEGKGTIEFNNKTMKCPECMGKGKFISAKQTNVVCEEPYIISTTKISINSAGGYSIRHSGYCGSTKLNRSEINLFSTKEQAQLECDELNKEKIDIKVEDIIIQDCFKENHPCIYKIQNKLAYYNANGRFDKEILIDKENTLKDGYINYLLCKLLNINVVKAVIEDNSIVI